MLISAERARTISQRGLFGARQFLQPARAQWLRDAVAADNMPPHMAAKWVVIESRPATHVMTGPLDPWSVPLYYHDPEGAKNAVAVIQGDSTLAVDYGLRYAVHGVESDAAQVVAILQAYTGTSVFESGDDSSLKWCEKWPLLVQAAMLVDKSPAMTPAIRSAFQATLLRALGSIERIGYTRENNWAAWGICAEIAVYGYVGDRARFDGAIRRWRELIDVGVKSGVVLQGQVRNNVPVLEMYRMGGSQGNGASGLQYANVLLGALTAGAEFARANGEWLYDHVTPDGSSFRGLYETVLHWSRYASPEVLWFNTSNQEEPAHPYYNQGYSLPHKFPWVEVLAALWPNTDVESLLEGSRESDGVTYPSISLPSASDVNGLRHTEAIYRGRPLYG